MDFLQDLFGKSAEKPPEKAGEAVSAYLDTDYHFNDIYSMPGLKAVSCRHILEEGTIPAGNSIGKYVHPEQNIDWDRDDAFTRALEKIRLNAVATIRDDEHLGPLLDKESWTRRDRIIWEATVSDIVSHEVQQIKGLDEYRTSSALPSFLRLGGNDSPTRPTCLNDLATDIEGGTKKTEFDCEGMSAVKGTTLQYIDNFFLPDSAKKSDFKVSSSYYYTVGTLNEGGSNSFGKHAFVCSSATGNIIEATASLYSYSLSRREDFTFADFLRGHVAHDDVGTTYGKEGTDMADVKVARRAKTGDWRQRLADRVKPNHGNNSAGLKKDVSPEDRYRLLDRHHQPGLSEFGQDNEKTDIRNYRYLAAIRNQVTPHMVDEKITGDALRDETGVITNFLELDLKDAGNLAEYERAIDIEIKAQQKIMSDHSSETPREEREDLGLKLYDDAAEKVEILEAAKDELDVYAYQVKLDAEEMAEDGEGTARPKRSFGFAVRNTYKLRDRQREMAEERLRQQQESGANKDKTPELTPAR
jgi:hypothetical protein